MRKLIKYVSYLLIVLIVVIAALLTYVKTALPDVGEPEDLKIEYTAERIERGRYLANSVSACMDCHSKRDFSLFSGPPAPGTLGMGGDRFDQTVGMPGVFYARNITSGGISRYTDGELFRVITTGVTREGRALFPFMPYLYYGRMDREDLYSIIAYIRTIAPIKNEVPESVTDFPMNFIVNTIPRKANPQTKPDTTDMLAYGAYMTNASGCIECHTPVDKGQIIQDMAFGGGRDFQFPDGSIVYSSNISPDTQTGIGSWTKEIFIKRFKAYADSTYVPEKVAPGAFNTIMPWTMYGAMTEQDLGAIYTYLKSVEPVSNSVTRFKPAN
ncbi:MAG: cytochrome c-related protein [Bacteroidetes bacterium OLB12]|nr:MAG: cytochrome c-related protein [Bacteroidetes bacterium OLB12]HNR74631.1 c-type cytochrome [Cyclobacteriaceae bacterium]HNU43545.1 c-type cytochrome [Cyclobacteriaceae bacterium]